MKLALIFLACLGLTCGKSIPSTRTLEDDLQDFLALVPVDQIIAIATDYIANDAEVQAAIAYLQSDEFETIVVTVDALPELQNFLNFLESNGLNAIDFLNGIHDLLGIPHIPVPARKHHLRRGVGISGLIDDVLAILPVDDLKALFNEKLETSPDFLALYNAIRSPEFQSIVQTLNSMPEYQNLLEKLREKGVDVDRIIELIRALFGLTLNAKATRNLQDDLQDFLALVPVDQIIAIATDYIANDAEVQAAIAYLQSDEFETIVVTVDALPELQNFLNFLESNGLNAIDFLNGIHDLLGIPHIPVPARKHHLRRGVGISGLIDDVLAILPVDDLKALFNEKLETSPDFLALYNAIRSPEFQSIVQTLNSMPEYQNLLEKLREKGVDVDRIIELIRALFGLTLNAKATRNLQDDLQDFLALVPVDQIIAIATDYIANDAEVQAAIAYLQSDEFETIVVTVDALPELQNFLNFLESNGLNAIDFLNGIHDLLGIPHIPVPARKHHLRRGVGISGLIDDVLAILPVDDLKALFNEKLETSPDFLALYNAIRSPEFQSIVQTLNSMPEYQNLLEKLREKGVDVDRIIELIRALFGLTLNAKATRNLQDDLQDFLALVPVDQIIAIATDYIANDAEVQAAIAYLQSDEFETIVVTVDALPELQNFLNFLESNGLNAIDFLNGIHDLLGIPHIPVPARKHHLRRGVGISGLIDDVLAILPVDDLKALFNEKLETSPDFLALYNAIRSPEFQSIVQTLNSMPEYQNLLEKLREKGVDVDRIIELIRALFGLTLNAKATRNLQDDLQDFLALVPVDQIIAIATDYIANDAEVQAAIAYLQSDEFETIVVTVDALPELQNFLNFLESNGLNAIDFLNGIHDLLGIPHIPVPARKHHLRRGVGISGLIDDVLAILPVDDLKALFNEKLETSPDFLALYNAIRSPEFQSIVQTLNSMPEYQNLLEKLREKGVDVDRIIELIRALFGLTLNAKATRNLQDDLQDFLALVPVDQIIAIATDYIANDAEVQAAIAYLQSDEFETIVVTVDALPELQNFLNFLESNGLNAIDFLNGIHDLLGIPHIPVPARKHHLRRGVGISGLIDDVLAILPVDDLKALFNEKLETSPDFLALYNAIRSPEFQSIVQTLNSMPEYQNLLEKLREKGVDVDRIIELIRALFGLTLNAKATRNLQDDLQDFLALVPVDQIIAIATDYIANDAEVQAAIAYLQSDEFETIVVTVDALPELQNFLNFLESNGLNAIDFLNGIHDLLGIPHIPVPARKHHLRRGVGISGLIDDVLAILPVDDLKALFNEKLETSPDFLALYNAIRSPEFQSIVQTLNSMPEYQNLLEKLREKGVDVDRIIELIRALFGLTLNAKATRNLQDDLQDFLALVPVDQIIAIATDYIANDAEVQAAIAYLQSDEFETIVVTVDALPELQNFLNFLESNGLNAIDFLNGIHDLLGIPHIPVPARKHHLRRGVGISGLIDDVLAILPVDDLKALFNEKLETSPDFLALYNAIRSPEFQSIVQTLNSMPEYQNLLEKLREKGVDVDRIIELIRALFGLTLNAKATRNLQDDLQDFLALVPVDQIIAIATDYIANDAEVQAAIAYLQSDEFETIVVTVDALPELQNFLNFLESNGLNAIDFLNGIHDLLGIPHIPVPARKHHLRRGVGISGLIDDVLAILPVDDLKALFNEKLETSPDFLALYNAIRSPEFQSIVQTLNAMPEYQNLLEKLREKGVDVDRIIELIRALFGLSH